VFTGRLLLAPATRPLLLLQPAAPTAAPRGISLHVRPSRMRSPPTPARRLA